MTWDSDGWKATGTLKKVLSTLNLPTTLPKLSDKDIILVPDFDSLETVAYRINKPITFTEVKKGKESIFTVIGDKEAYVFRLKDY